MFKVEGRGAIAIRQCQNHKIIIFCFTYQELVLKVPNFFTWFFFYIFNYRVSNNSNFCLEVGTIRSKGGYLTHTQKKALEFLNLVSQCYYGKQNSSHLSVLPVLAFGVFKAAPFSLTNGQNRTRCWSRHTVTCNVSSSCSIIPQLFTLSKFFKSTVWNGKVCALDRAPGTAVGCWC